MNKYEDMSYPEIDKAVALIKFKDCIKLEVFENAVGGIDIISQGIRIVVGYSPTSDPSDAWPIIEQIWDSLMFVEVVNYECYWDVMAEKHGGKLRAAMVVFLMMKEGEL